MKTEREIVDGCNRLAQKFYRLLGYVVPDDCKMYEATHPHEMSMWQMAVEAYEHIEDTDVENALSNILEE